MGRVYSASFENITVTALQDFFEIIAPSTAVVIVHSAFIGQSSDFGDAQAEMLRINLVRFTGANGSGGAAVTPVAHQAGFAGFGGTVRRNDTTQGATRTIIQSYAFNVQAGFFYQPTPEERLVIAPSGKLAVGLPAAPADSLTMSGTITFEQLG